MLKKVRRPVEKPVENEESQTSQLKQEGGNEVMSPNNSTSIDTKVQTSKMKQERRNDLMSSIHSTNLDTNIVPFSNDSSSTSNVLRCFNAALTLPQEGWQEAIIQSVESTTPVKTKRGECNRIKVDFFLQDQQIQLVQNILLINLPNYPIMQLIDACIQPDENRRQYNLMNLVNHEVFVRIQKNVKGERTFYNVVEVKPLEANIEGELG